MRAECTSFITRSGLCPIDAGWAVPTTSCSGWWAQPTLRAVLVALLRAKPAERDDDTQSRRARSQKSSSCRAQRAAMSRTRSGSASARLFDSARSVLRL